MVALLLAAVLSASPSQVGRSGAQCITEYGITACGYQCIARHGQVKCAQTPVGICFVEGDEVTCWDPRGWYPTPQTNEIPRPKCVKEYGEIDCGWACLARHGQQLCAQTPDGLCVLFDGEVRCWDPPVNLRAYYKGAALPRAHCEEAYGQLACGFECLARYGELKCAGTPEGMCRADGGKVECWDPPM